MIPKIIHYCWFGGGQQPQLIRSCIKSWKTIMPDYELKLWNEDNFDVNSIPFVAQAYQEKKWAFVADYVRFYALYNEGGIYLDTDVEVFKRLDPFLHNPFFAGTELRYSKGKPYITVDASAFGCIRKHWYTKKCMEFYHGKNFRNPDGTITGGVVQGVATVILEDFGYKRINETQIINNEIQIYSTDYFSNIENFKTGSDVYTLHHFDGSWVDNSNRGPLYKFARKYDLMQYYRLIEKFIKYIKIKTRLRNIMQ